VLVIWIKNNWFLKDNKRVGWQSNRWKELWNWNVLKWDKKNESYSRFFIKLVIKWLVIKGENNLIIWLKWETFFKTKSNYWNVEN